MKIFRYSVAAVFALVIAAGAAPAVPATSAAVPLSFAVIGDVPYGTSQLTLFAGRVDQLNADPNLQLVVHVGDISSPPNCSNQYYATIKSHFDRVADPLVYTPGDNEWADCHRASVGAANPLDRLTAIRNYFFPRPGWTLGRSQIPVSAQPGYKENVNTNLGGLTIGSFHAVGSYNDLAPWTGNSSPTQAQTAEFNARTTANIAHIRTIFAAAKAASSRAVVLLTQADMFIGAPGATYRTAFQTLVQTIASESTAFALPVFLFNGDSHVFAMDKPLTQAKWLAFYGVAAPVTNLTRITIEGAASLDEWVKVTVNATPSVLTVQRVAFR